MGFSKVNSALIKVNGKTPIDFNGGAVWPMLSASETPTQTVCICNFYTGILLKPVLALHGGSLLPCFSLHPCPELPSVSTGSALIRKSRV